MTTLRRLTRFATALLLTALALNAWSGRLSAQCPVPDQLDGGPCCALAMENIPFFPKVAVDTLDICWRDCGVDSVRLHRAVWTPIKILSTTGPDCGSRRSRLDIFDGAGVLEWTGTMRLLYSRTWLELGPAGPLQVWRFLVNGNLRPTAVVGPAPCPLPPCAPAFGNVKYTGYIDYAQSCAAAGGLQIAWMLSHVCDVIDHAPGFPRAGAFHPGRDYTFVGPAAGFAPAPVVAAEGTGFSAFEDVRRMRFPLPGTTGPIQCEFEEPFRHTLTVTQQCLCTVGPPLNPQWVLGSLNGNGACGTAVTTTGLPFLPGFLSMSVGSWTIPGAYPGVEDLRWNAGGYDYTDPCTGVAQPEVFFGVTTLGGYAPIQITSGGPGVGLPSIFIDQANSITAFGAPLMNVVYSSDHILNLNE